MVKSQPCLCYQWKRVVLDTWMDEKYISGMCRLLRYSSHLEELLINISTEPPWHFLPQDIGLELHGSGHVWANNCNSEFMIRNLKTATMHGLFKDSCSAQMELVKIILKNAPNLEKVCIYNKGNARPTKKCLLSTHQLSEISKKLLTFPKASKQAMVSLL